MSTFNDPNVKKVIASSSTGLLQSATIALAAVALAYLLYTFGKTTPVFLYVLQVLSFVLVASTILGASSVVSWSRVTPAEQLEKRLLHWMTRASLFLSTLALSLMFFAQ